MNNSADSDNLRTKPGLGWHQEDVKAELRKKYGSLSAVSKMLGVSRQSISGVLGSPMASIKIEKAIALALDVQPCAIWPARWRPDGTPIARNERLESIKFQQKLSRETA